MYGFGGVPGAGDGDGAVDVRDEVSSDVEVFHLEGDVQLPLAVSMGAIGVLGDASPHGGKRASGGGD